MKRPFRNLGISLIAALLVACGGSGGSGPAADAPGAGTSANNGLSAGTESAPQTATIGIVITDTPDSQYDEAIATITRIELIGSKGKQVVFSGSVVVDLFKLRDFVELLTIADDVEPDTISKIRLQLSSLVLITRDDSGAVEERVDTHLAGNGKIDLKPERPFTIAPAEVLFVTFDFDIDKSLKITEAGNGKVIVRPVVFVRVGTAPGFKEGITRVSGEIARINDLGDAFLLCMTDLMATPLNSSHVGVPERCVKVRIDSNTGLFGEDGLPIEASELAPGDTVTVVGKLGLPDDDPVIQPIATDARQSNGDSDSSSDSDSDSDSDGGGNTRPPLQFVLEAIVVERGAPGTFASIRGVLTSGVDDKDQYSLLVADEQGFAPDSLLLGQLYPKSRIFNFTGREIGRSELLTGDRALIDGVILITDAEGERDTLRTALMLVRRDGSPEPDDEILVGKVLGVDEQTQQLKVATDTGDRCVLADETDVLFVVDNGDEVEIIEGKITDLADGTVVVIFGVEDTGGCFDADTIISRAPPKIPELL